MKAETLLDAARQYAAANKRTGGRPCRVCALPAEVRTAVHEIHTKEGASLRVVADWLTTLKVPEVGVSSLQKHFVNHVK